MKNREKLFIGSVPVAAGVVLSYFRSRSDIHEDAEPVEEFDVKCNLGTWYEIAQFDYRFGKNIGNTVAQYSLNDNKHVQVRNSGYDHKKQKGIFAKGITKFRDKTTAASKISFFGRLCAGYHVIALDEDYQYAMGTGSNPDYLSTFSRTKTIPENIKRAYRKIAEKEGYNTSELVWVKYDKTNPYAA